jgi:hypothetical protein
MSTAVIEREASQDALPVCPWSGNLNGLVSLLEIMEFDAGGFGNAMCFLTTCADMLDKFPASQRGENFKTLSEDSSNHFLDHAKDIASYCAGSGFPMTQVPLDRILELSSRGHLTVEGFCGMAKDAMMRLRDEAYAKRMFCIPAEKASYHLAYSANPGHSNTVEELWSPIFNSFGSTKYDALEAFRCYALGRNTACVFHLMRVLELGLAALGNVFNVSLAHTNWAPAIDQIESRIGDMQKDPVWKMLPDCKVQQEFYSQAASYFGILKDAWRNYTAHARGKYDENEAGDILMSVRAFMQKLTAKGLHE